VSNPTNPFSWQMPTPTDLVTDLPADFEVFGQAVATSLADLLGGTTDQVLAKNSNTDMDFKWVTSDDANAIQNSIVNAKGDIIGASANDTPAITSVGANTAVLVADSTEATGLKWEGVWTAFTPTYGNLTIGNGTVIARYRKVGKTVEVFYRLTWGSTTSCGNYPFVGYPAGLTPAFSTSVFTVGNVTLHEVGVGIWLGLTLSDTSNGLLFMSQNSAGTYVVDGVVNATQPASLWTTGDIWTMTATYEAA
jgi:hypothetical protein